MKRRHTGMPTPINCASSNRAYLIVAGLIVAGFIFVRLIIAVNPRLSNISKVNRRGEPALV